MFRLLSTHLEVQQKVYVEVESSVTKSPVESFARLMPVFLLKSARLLPKMSSSEQLVTLRKVIMETVLEKGTID